MQAKCIDDAAYLAASNDAAQALIKKSAQDLILRTGIALYQRNVSKQINDWKTEIADRQVAMAEAAHAHAAGFYPAEAALVNDSMAIPKAAPEYFALASGWTTFTDEANDASRAGWLKASRDMCMPPDRCDDGRWSSHARALTVDTGNFALRQAENRAQALKDVRYELMLKALKLGQGRISSGGGYAAAAGTIADKLGDSIMGGINSAAEALGFETHRERNAQWANNYEPRTMQVREAQRSSSIDMRDKPVRTIDAIMDNFSRVGFVRYQTSEPSVKDYNSYSERNSNYGRDSE